MQQMSWKAQLSLAGQFWGGYDQKPTDELRNRRCSSWRFAVGGEPLP